MDRLTLDAGRVEAMIDQLQVLAQVAAGPVRTKVRELPDNQLGQCTKPAATQRESGEAIIRQAVGMSAGPLFYCLLVSEPGKPAYLVRGRAEASASSSILTRSARS